MGWSLGIKTPGHNKCFFRKVINSLQASLTETKIEQSDSGRENNPDLSQEAEEQEAEDANADSDVTADASKVSENYDNMIFSMKKDQKTFEYQETMRLDVKNIAKNKKTNGDQYMKLLMLRFLKKRIFFHNIF